MSNPFLIFTREQLIYLIAVFLLGIVIGSTLLNLYVSYRIDELILQNNKLKSTIKEKNTEIEQLEKNIKDYRQQFIQTINIDFKTDLNKHLQQKLKEKTKELLTNLRGRNINDLDLLLILENTLNNRQLSIENKNITLHLFYVSYIDDQLNLIIIVHDQNDISTSLFERITE